MTRSSGRAVIWLAGAALTFAWSTLKAAEPKPTAPVIQFNNLTYEYFEGDWNALPDFDRLKPVAQGEAPNDIVDASLAKRQEYFGLRFQGDLRVERAGDYTFFLDSDDGSRLTIDGKVVIAHDGLHGVGTVKIGKVKLAKGKVPVEVVMFEKTGDQDLLLWVTAADKKITSLSRSTENLLAYAIHRGDAAMIKELLKSDIDINVPGVNGRTPLSLAVSQANVALVKTLLDAKADPNAKDTSGRTPLLAMQFYDPQDRMTTKLINMLVAAGANIKAKGADGQTLLHNAQYFSKAVVKRLIDAGVDVNSKNGQGLTPLHLAMQWHRTDMVPQLIAAGADIYATDENGQSPLSIALRPHFGGRPHGALGPILAAVKDPNVKVAGEYPVHIAARYGLPKVLATLAVKKANLAIEDDQGRTPLAVAMTYNQLAAFDYLFPKTKDVSNISTGDGQGILHWAVERRLAKTVSSLVSRGCDVNAKNTAGETALYIAAWNGDAEMAKALIDAEADPNVVDQSGASALYAAAWNNRATIIPLLVNAGAKLPTKGNTPLHAAAWQGHILTVRTLLALKAPLDAQDTDGSTPLHEAAWRGQTQIVKALLAAGADKSIQDVDGFTAADKARDAGDKGKAARALLADSN